METPNEPHGRGVQRRGSRGGSEQPAPAGLQGWSPGETVLLAVGTILLCALGYAVAPVLSPFVLTGAIVFILHPLRNSPLAKRLFGMLIAVPVTALINTFTREWERSPSRREQGPAR